MSSFNKRPNKENRYRCLGQVLRRKETKGVRSGEEMYVDGVERQKLR